MIETDIIEPPAAKVKHNWMAIYTAYCNGASIPELVEVFGVPEGNLKARAAAESWSALRAKMPLVTNPAGLKLVGRTGGLPAETEEKFKEIEANRAKNFKVFADLREHLIETVTALKEGRLRFEKQWAFKGGEQISAEAPPTSGDMVNLATYARTIAEGTYRALGDFVGDAKIAGANAGASATNAPQAAITIILPAAISTPREQRNLPESGSGKQSQVIDVEQVATPPATEG